MNYKIVNLRNVTLWKGDSYVEALSHHNVLLDNGIRCSLIEVESTSAMLARLQATYGY